MSWWDEEPEQSMIDRIKQLMKAARERDAREQLDKAAALARLDTLKTQTQKFYNGTAGKAQLQWLDDYEANMLATALTSSDETERLALLDQAKGLQAFRAYIDTLMH